jgi:multidrug efflux pump subunit AcrB
MPVIDVFAGVSGRDLAGVLKDIRPLIAAAEKELPKGSAIILRGQADTMQSSFAGLGIGLGLAVAFIYLLLVVNFQSWLIWRKPKSFASLFRFRRKWPEVLPSASPRR